MFAIPTTHCQDEPGRPRALAHQGRPGRSILPESSSWNNAAVHYRCTLKACGVQLLRRGRELGRDAWIVGRYGMISGCVSTPARLRYGFPEQRRSMIPMLCGVHMASARSSNATRSRWRRGLRWQCRSGCGGGSGRRHGLRRGSRAERWRFRPCIGHSRALSRP
jgi:hypothetical protein